jgi:hypothetical protein
MVSFDVVSLFTKVPKNETIYQLGRHFGDDVQRLIHHVLTTSYFTFNGQSCGHTDGVVMGSPLPPIIAHFYMEDYEKVTLESGC